MAPTSSFRLSHSGVKYVSLDDFAHGVVPEALMVQPAASLSEQQSWQPHNPTGEYWGSSSFDDRAPKTLTASSAVSPPDQQRSSDGALTMDEEREIAARLMHFINYECDQSEQSTPALTIGDTFSPSEGHRSDTNDMFSDPVDADNDHTMSEQPTPALTIDDAFSPIEGYRSDTNDMFSNPVNASNEHAVSKQYIPSLSVGKHLGSNNDMFSGPFAAGNEHAVSKQYAPSRSVDDHLAVCEEYLASNNDMFSNPSFAGNNSSMYSGSSFACNNNGMYSAPSFARNYQPVGQFNPFQFTSTQDFENFPVHPADLRAVSAYHHGNEDHVFNANDYCFDWRTNPEYSFISPQSRPAVQSTRCTNPTSMSQSTNAGLNDGLLLGSNQGNFSNINATSMYQPTNAVHNDGLYLNLSSNPETPLPGPMSPFTLSLNNFTKSREDLTAGGVQSNRSVVTDTVAGTTGTPVKPARRVAKPRKSNPVPKKTGTAPKTSTVSASPGKAGVRPFNEIRDVQWTSLNADERLSALPTLKANKRRAPTAPSSSSPSPPKAKRSRRAAAPLAPTPTSTSTSTSTPATTPATTTTAPMSVQQKRLQELVQAFVASPTAQADFNSKSPGMSARLHHFTISAYDQANMMSKTLSDPAFQRAFAQRLKDEAAAAAAAPSYGAQRQREALDRAERAALQGKRR